jgi:hypothetical protein
MATPAAAATLSVKLLIDRKAQRLLFTEASKEVVDFLLLFAEASKEAVDFLFSFLALPVATAVKLVGKDAMVGCVGNTSAGFFPFTKATTVSAVYPILLIETITKEILSSLQQHPLNNSLF